MQKFDKYVIVSDLDGTFFGEKSSILSKNVDAISYFKENGGTFTFATGRDFPVLEKALPQADEIASCPAILCNGSYLYDFKSRSLSNESMLDQTELIRLLDQIEKEFPNVSYRISSEVGFLCPKMLPYMKERLNAFLDITIVEDLEKLKKYRWHKCVFVCAPDVNVRLVDYMHTLSMSTSKITVSSTSLSELIPISAGKDSKIAALRALFPGKQFICVGDQENDIDMLMAADIPACPDNSIPAVKQISKIQLCHHRDGCIADLIYKLDASLKE